MTETNDDKRAQWNAAAFALSFRAEELKDATATFAETVFVDVLKAKQNQIVSGRRGTGKTHILKRLKEEYLRDFDKYRSVPVFINGSQLRRHANVVAETPSVIALSLYVEFAKELTYSLHEFINSQLEIDWWKKLVGGKDAQTAQKAQAIARQLYDLVKNGEARLLPAGEASDEVQTINEAAAKLAAGVNLNLSDPKNIGFKLDASASEEAKSSGVSLRKIKGQVILPFGQVSAKIQELLTLLDGAKLVVLFDEWSDIDSRLDTQPYLADMLKRTLSSITHMHTKLACIPVRTLLATPISADNPIPIGYEIGEDISADIDLDAVICIDNDLKQFLPFFMTVLKKHMEMSLEWVKEMEMPTFEVFVFDEVFDSADVFSELCQASSGIPRDFLQLFRTATARQVNQACAKINLSHIRKSAEQLFEGKKNSFKAGAAELSILDNIYRKIVAKQKTYLFLLEESHCANPAIQILWMQKLIHRMPKIYFDENSYRRYCYFQIDYGKCVDLLIAYASKTGAEKGNTLARIINNFDPPTWFKSVAGFTLPKISAFLEKQEALASEPAGNLAPDPREIIVEEELIKVGGASLK